MISLSLVSETATVPQKLLWLPYVYSPSTVG